MAWPTTETFAGTAGTAITALANGITWARHASASNSGAPTVNGSGQLVTTENNVNENYRNTDAPPDANQPVRLKWTHVAGVGEAIVGPTARASSSTSAQLLFIYYLGGTQFRFQDTGALLGTPVNLTAVDGETYDMTLEPTGANSAVCRVQRSNGDWLTSAGAWQSTQVNCITVATGITTTAAGFGGLYALCIPGGGGQRFRVEEVGFGVASSDVTAPTITGPGGITTGPSTPGGASSINVTEGGTTVFDFSADETVTWDKNGGADAALFTINSSTGILSFSSAPTYDSVTPANNVRVVGVRATDAASNATTQTVTVTVRKTGDAWPASDVSVSGWTATPAGILAATLDEGVASDADYITSPTLTSTPSEAIFDLPASLPAGSYVIKVRANVSTGTGTLVMSLLNGSNVSQGASAGQALTTVLTTYDIPVVTTGAATRVKMAINN